MPQERLTDLAGSRGRIGLHEWRSERPRYAALIAHGYGEHARRYAHVAEHLVRHGAAVYAPDHLGHGRSERHSWSPMRPREPARSVSRS